VINFLVSYKSVVFITACDEVLNCEGADGKHGGVTDLRINKNRVCNYSWPRTLTLITAEESIGDVSHDFLHDRKVLLEILQW